MNVSTRCPFIFSSSATCMKSFLNQVPSRSFSSTQPQNARRATRQRRQMYNWLSTQGDVFRNPLPNSTNYLGAYNAAGQLRRAQGGAAAKKAEDGELQSQEDATGSNRNSNLPPETVKDLIPFVYNKTFVSPSVLSEEMREKIWERVMLDARSVREVSVEFGVDMRRVGAVVRLKEIEKEWERTGKPLARPYAEAVMSMVPKTEYNPNGRNNHESINDLPVHAATGPQIFYPTSESRHFTRVDAAKVFDEKLLPADERIPHPQMIQSHKDFKLGIPFEERMQREEARKEAEEKKRQGLAASDAKKEASVKKVESQRWQFRFTEINVDDIGKDGRGPKGTGWRYGRPLMDRSRGQVKIPTSVP
ncbi:hypothetical protein ACMFMG_002272 [Clarireedia jacksonii]